MRDVDLRDVGLVVVWVCVVWRAPQSFLLNLAYQIREIGVALLLQRK